MPRQRWWIEAALYGAGAGRRYTQDGPVLPDVWTEFLSNPGGRCDLLIEPWRDTQPSLIAMELQSVSRKACVTYNRTMAVASLTLEEILKKVLPLAGWYGWVWKENVFHHRDTPNEFSLGFAPDDFPLPAAAQIWADVQPSVTPGYRCPRLLSLVRVAGLIADLQQGGEEELTPLFETLRTSTNERALDRALASLGTRMLKAFRQLAGPSWPEPGRELIYTINRNRRATLALHHSVKTVKGDAAHHLFSIRCEKLTWAIIDSGIDATHPAFLVPSDRPDVDEHETPVAKRLRSRVRETYDFSNLRDLLLGRGLEQLEGVHRQGHENVQEERRFYREILLRLRRHRMIDWELLRPFLRVPHDEHYVEPTNGHGTHVAGILGAKWDRGSTSLNGMCPDINLIDIRILKQDGTADEFSVASALQFLRHLNAHADRMAVHGANISLSLLHDAANYACGQTPICEEAERTVSSGIVVVAAAGNHGYRRFLVENEEAFDQFCPVSITDPGNAESVITVGSTHRMQPHTYGVSYFSSRGPTGDGRNKPDLVAPGEKIYAPTLGGLALRLDGTSMAAPHVSGAAAMLMARHVELVGRPARIKKILCDTATDLGRERYYQGHGLVDILRALQSV